MIVNFDCGKAKQIILKVLTNVLFKFFSLTMKFCLAVLDWEKGCGRGDDSCSRPQRVLPAGVICVFMGDEDRN